VFDRGGVINLWKRNEMKIMILLLLSSSVLAVSHEYTPYVGGPIEDSRSSAPIRIIIEGSDNIATPIDVVNTFCNKAYVTQIATQGAQMLRKELQAFWGVGMASVAINFVVRGGWAALPAYYKEFCKENRDGLVQFGLLYVNIKPCACGDNMIEGCDKVLAKGDIMVVVDDYSETDWGQYPSLALLERAGCGGRIILCQYLMEKQAKEKIFWHGSEKIIGFEASDMRSRLLSICGAFQGSGVLRNVILRFEQLSAADYKGTLVLPYDARMPGKWPDVHDCLDCDHKKKDLVVIPAIMYRDAKGVLKAADFELALCQTMRGDLCHQEPRVIYATLLASVDENEQVQSVSDLLHVDRDLLEKHKGSVVMVLSERSLKIRGLVDMVQCRCEIPVNTKSVNHMPLIHSAMRCR